MNNSDEQRLRERYEELAEKEQNKSKEKLVSKATLNLKIDSDDSNKIMVYCGNYVVEKIYSNLTKEYLTYEENLNASYKLYIDVETHEMYKVPLDKCSEFESKYIIIKRKAKIYNYQEYDKIYDKVRNEFFTEVIDGTSQSKAIKKLMNLKKE